MNFRRGRECRLVLVALFALLLAGGALRSTAATAADPLLVGVWKVYPPGWNLVAGPAGSRIALHGETVLGLDDGAPGYTQASEAIARAGRGYWVYYPVGATLLLVGAPRDVTTTHVAGGSWALLGNSGARTATVRGADLALVYDPLAGWTMANQVPPGQAALVYADGDADVYMDPFSPVQPPYTPLIAVPAPSTPPPALPSVAGATETPTEELNYLLALGPVLSDVDQRLGDFADNVDTADPTQPASPMWQQLRNDASGMADDEAALEALAVPSRYLAVHEELVGALIDLRDGMTNTIEGLLAGNSDRVGLGSGLLQSGARRLIAAEQSLPE